MALEFFPGDLLAEGWFHFSLIRRAGPGGNGAHALVGDHLAVRLPRPLGGDRPFLPVVFVEAAHIQRGRHDNLRPEAGQPFGEFQAGIADVYRAVDMRTGDVQQFSGAGNFRHAHQNRHGYFSRRSMLPAQHGLIVVSQCKCHGLVVRL